MLFSFCSLSYQYLITNLNIYIFSDTFVWRSLTIGLFILGLSYSAYQVSKKNNSSIEYLLKVEKKIILLAIFTTTLYYLNDNIANYLFSVEKNAYDSTNLLLLKNNLILYKIYFISFSSIISFLFGYYTGYELPIISDLCNNENSGKLLFFNYLGSLISGLIVVILVSHLNIHLTFINILMINLIGILILNQKLLFKNILIYSILIITSFYTTDYFKSLSLNSKYNLEYLNYDWKNIFYREDFLDIKDYKTKYQTVDIITEKKDVKVFLDGKFQLDTKAEKDYHHSMVHIPFSLKKVSYDSKVLILGGGDGFILREVFKYKINKENITHVELDSKFLDLMNNNEIIKEKNKGSLDNIKIKRIIDDAYSWIKKNNTKYDFVIIDFPYPYSYDLARLYSIEFYSFVKESLKKNGIALVDIPLFRKKYLQRYDYDNELNLINNILYATITKVNFNYSKFFKINNEGFVLLSNKELNDQNFYDIKLKKEYTSYFQFNFKTLKKQDFNFQYQENNINSIFHPKFQNFKSLHSKY